MGNIFGEPDEDAIENLTRNDDRDYLRGHNHQRIGPVDPNFVEPASTPSDESVLEGKLGGRGSLGNRLGDEVTTGGSGGGQPRVDPRKVVTVGGGQPKVHPTSTAEQRAESLRRSQAYEQALRTANQQLLTGGTVASTQPKRAIPKWLVISGALAAGFGILYLVTKNAEKATQPARRRTARRNPPKQEEMDESEEDYDDEED